MYKSFPLVISYILLFAFVLMNVFYQLFMGFGCGEEDCFLTIFASYKQTLLTSYELVAVITVIAIFWKVKQMMLLGLGLY